MTALAIDIWSDIACPWCWIGKRRLEAAIDAFAGPTEPISRAIELTLAGFQQDFPVMDGDGLLGVLTHADVLKGLAERGANLPVREAMRGELETASPSEALDGALTRMHRAKSRVLAVVKNEKVVGFLTLGNIGELLALQAAGRRPGASASGTGDGTGR